MKTGIVPIDRLVIENKIQPRFAATIEDSFRLEKIQATTVVQNNQLRMIRDVESYERNIKQTTIRRLCEQLEPFLIPTVRNLDERDSKEYTYTLYVGNKR